jgi:hypothetical protein
MGVDVMPGRYLDKLHLVRVSTGIFPAGGDGHNLILPAVNNGDRCRRWWWGLVETAVSLPLRWFSKPAVSNPSARNSHNVHRPTVVSLPSLLLFSGGRF